MYKYDYKGRRVKKVVTAAYGTANSTTTTYTYDGEGTLLRKFVYGPGIDEPIRRIHAYGGEETMFYYHFDGLGSVVALSDNAGEPYCNGDHYECH